MKHNLNHLCRSMHLALTAAAVSVVSLASTGISFAQDSPDQAVKLDTISITGSRIRRAADVETAQPVLIITKQDIQRSGLQNIGDVLSNLTVADNTSVTTVNNNTNANDGSINISLRGIGAQRTLVLLNGRRWVGDQDGIVDLNSVPLAIVERIDILKDGASAIYGSDAVAGVVNILTRQSFEGGEANAYVGETSEGDGRVESYDYTLGGSSDKISFVTNIAYSKQEAIFAGDREISRVATFGILPPNGGESATPPRGRFIVPGNTGPGGAGSITLIPGRSGASANDFRAYDGRIDSYNFAPANYLQQPFDRFSVFQQLNYQITDGIRFSNTVNYIKRRGNQQIAEVPITLNSSGANGPQFDFGDSSVAANNVFNPFGRPVTGAFFRAIALGERANLFDFDTWAYTGVVDGAFTVAERDFSWDVGYQYQSFDKDQAGENYVNLFNLRNALGPSYRDANGVLRCGTPGAQAIAGCTPFNFFGGPDLGVAAGRISAQERQQMLDYIGYTLVEQKSTKLKNYSANITGDLIDLPAGPLGIAAGYEYRNYDYSDRPDSLISEGGSSNNFREPTRGSVSSDELYVELAIPVLADVFLARSLELGIASRYSDYSAQGTIGLRNVAPDLGNDTSSKFNFRWQPIDDLLLRGSWAQTFRAPSVNDLFSGGTEGFPAVIDPCRSGVGGPTGGQYQNLTQQQRDRCTAQGVPVGGYIQPNSQIRQLTGGNPTLVPETGITRTLGTVYSPAYVPNFNVSLDWYRVELTDALVTFGGQTVLNRCVRDGESALCQFITRVPGGEVSTVRGVPFNAAALVSEGYDFGMNYLLDSDWGKFRWVFNSSYVSEIYTQTDGGEIDNEAGELNSDTANWRTRASLATNWSTGAFDVTWTMRYLSKLEEACAAQGLFAEGGAVIELCNPNLVDADGQQYRILGALTYHDLQAGWNAPWKGRIVAGVRNAFGKEPPTATNTFANSFPQGYDLPGGAFYYVSYQQKF